MSLHQDVIRFDREVNSATTILNTVKQLINERSAAIKEQKQVLSIDQELRLKIAKLKEFLPSEDPFENEFAIDIQETTLIEPILILNNILQSELPKKARSARSNYSVSRRNSNSSNRLHLLVDQVKTRFERINRQQQQQQHYILLFNGRNGDVEMQDLSSKSAQEQSAYRQKQWQAQEDGLREAAEITEQLITGNKDIHNKIGESNEILDTIDKRADAVNQRMLTMQDKFENLLKTTSNNTLWIVIIANIFIMVALIAL